MEHSRVDVEYLVARSGLTKEYAVELSRLRETCAAQLASFPSSLQQTGEASLRRHAGRWYSIDLALPLILGGDWSVPGDARQTLALANAHMVVYGYIQKRAADERTRSSSDVLPLGSLLCTRALRQYQQIFSPFSSFWPLLEGYQLEWAEAIRWPRRRQWGQVRRYSREDILRLAGNRALVKIGGAAVALLAGKPRMLRSLSSVLDQIHIATQLVDGLINWRQDLHARRATYFLTEAALAMGARNMAVLGRVNVEALLLTSFLPGKVAKCASNHLSTAKKLASQLEAPALMLYLDDLRAAIGEIPHRFEDELADVLPNVEHVPVSLSF